MSVALLGPDGSGKSSIAERISADSPLPVHREYLGLYPAARRAAGDALPGLAGVRRVLRVWRAWARGAAHARRGGLTLFDRHPLEAGINAAPRIRQRLLARSCPTPDLVILLDAPAATVHARKPEHPLPFVEAQRDAYLALAARRGDVRVLEGTGSLEEVTADVTGLIWREWQGQRAGAESVVPM